GGRSARSGKHAGSPAIAAGTSERSPGSPVDAGGESLSRAPGQTARCAMIYSLLSRAPARCFGFPARNFRKKKNVCLLPGPIKVEGAIQETQGNGQHRATQRH